MPVNLIMCKSMKLEKLKFEIQIRFKNTFGTNDVNKEYKKQICLEI